MTDERSPVAVVMLRRAFFINLMSIRADKYDLAVVWILKTLEWSDRRIARAKLPRSHHTVTSYYKKACELKDARELPISGKGERKLRIMPFGKSSDVEYLEGKIHQNPCGGGKRKTPHRYDDKWKDVAEE